jgi:predicted transporter
MTSHWSVLLLLLAALGGAVFGRHRRRFAGSATRTGVVVIVLLLLGSGCATVKPWERETLAKPCMIFSSNTYEVVLEQHLLQYREGAAGGFGGGGGGCGCN